MNDLEARLRAVDPLRSMPKVSVPAPAAAQTGRDLARQAIASMPAGQPDRSTAVRLGGSRRWLRLAVPVVLLLAVSALTLTRTGSTPARAQPATPTLLTFDHGPHELAADVLRRAAAALRALPLPTGPLVHSRTQSWSLSTNVSGSQATTQLLTTTRELWLAPDGSGRAVDTERATPISAGQALIGPVLRTGTSRLTPSTFANTNAGLPDTADQLRAVLADRTSQMGLSPAINFGDEILTDLSYGTATRLQQAAMLEVLADTPSLFSAGSVTDRAGRAGLAVGLVTSGPTSPTTGTVYLIVDPTSGRPLATETVYSPDPPRGLHLRPGPLVAGYNLFLLTEQLPLQALPR